MMTLRMCLLVILLQFLLNIRRKLETGACEVYPREVIVTFNLSAQLGLDDNMTLPTRIQRSLISSNGCEHTRISLDLSWNNLSGIPGSFFDFPCAKRIVSLDISFNKIYDFATELLRPLTSLRTLDISHNSLASLSPGFLPPTLVNLNASNNRFRVVQNNLFKGLYCLQTLDMSNNFIAKVQPRAFQKDMFSVMLADLSFNRLTSFEPWPYMFDGNVYVDLSYNQISAFTNKMNLTLSRQMYKAEFNLAHNNLRTIILEDLRIYWQGKVPQTFKLLMLFMFDLNVTNNPWVCNCDLFPLVKAVTGHFLSRHPYTRTFLTCAEPPVLSGRSMGFLLDHPELLTCDITDQCPLGCRCEIVPQLDHVRVVCDPQLRIHTSLPSQLPGDGQLALNLTGHALHVLETGHCDVIRLQVLDVSDNQIEQVMTSFLEAAINLQVLDLRNNWLSWLPHNVQRLSIDHLHLTGNPLLCSCDLVWLGSWIRAVAANVSHWTKTTTSSLTAAAVTTVATTNSVSLSSLHSSWGFTDDVGPDSRSSFEFMPTTMEEKTHPAAVSAMMSLTCAREDETSMLLVEISDAALGCGEVAVAGLVVGGVAVLLMGVGIVLCWRWRTEVRILAYYYTTELPCCQCEKKTVRFAAEDTRQEECPSLHAERYDVYVSVDEADDRAVTWVAQTLLPMLEGRGSNPLLVYFPLRQEPPGVPIAESRAEVVSRSNSVLVVLSKGYPGNKWCRHEFDHACESLQHRLKTNLIIIILDCRHSDHDETISMQPPVNVQQTENKLNSREENADREEKLAFPDEGVPLTNNNQFKCGQLREDEVMAVANDENDAVAGLVCPVRRSPQNVKCLYSKEHPEHNPYVHFIGRGRETRASMGANRKHNYHLNEDTSDDKTIQCDGGVRMRDNVTSCSIHDRRSCDNQQTSSEDDSAGRHTKTLRAAQDGKLGHGGGRKSQSCAVDARVKRTRSGRPSNTARRLSSAREQRSRYVDGVGNVTIEPLRTFLEEGRYLRLSDRLFKHKLLYRLDNCANKVSHGRKRRKMDII